MADAVETFRAEVRDWLTSTNRPSGLRDYGATPAHDDVGPGRAWQQNLAKAHLACIAWPEDRGGRAVGLASQAAFAEECTRAGVPRQLNIVGPDLVGPVLLAHGTDSQQDRWLEPIRTGQTMWCQLFSETEAGSDLAALRTAASPGDDWTISGSKVWSSGADDADLGLLLARTGPERFDLSLFVLDMASTGVEVRPLRQMDGEAKFNEVHLHEVHLPAEHLLGAVGDGWKLAMSTLGTERLNLGAQAVALLAHLEQVDIDSALNPRVARETATRLRSRIWLLQMNFRRLLASGRPISDPMFSLLKLGATEVQRDLVRFAVDAQGIGALASDGDLPSTTARFLAQPGQTIAGGTSEVQRNILAERVLGLPR